MSDSGNKRIEIFDSNGSYLDTIQMDKDNVPLFERPHGVAVDKEGYIYVIDNNQTIKRFYPDGILERQWGTEGNGDGEFMDASDIAIDENRTVYVTDALLHRVQKFDRYGNYLGQWGSEGNEEGQFQEPVGITINKMQRVYVSDSQNNRIEVFDKNGTFINAWEGNISDEGEYGYPYDVVTMTQNAVVTTGIIDSRNNRFLIYRSLQLDIDGDNIGDVCDSNNNDGPLGDSDGDGILNNDDMYANDGPLGDWDGDGILNQDDTDDSTAGYGLSEEQLHHTQGANNPAGRISGNIEQDTQPYAERNCGYYGRACIQGTQEDDVDAEFDSATDFFLPDRPICDPTSEYWSQGTVECVAK